MTVSWVVLTMNRADKVQHSMVHNKQFAGAMWNEIIWVDNGSRPEQYVQMISPIAADLRVENRRNRGVAFGLNQAISMCRSDYVVITGCDMLMPENWLKTFKEYIERIPNTGIACIYSEPIEQTPERLRGPRESEIINGLPILRAMPIGRRILSRKLFNRIGFFREDFGLYGWEDVEWANRAERVCAELGLLHYVIPGQIATHLGTEGTKLYDGKGDDKEYHEFKQREAKDPRKQEVMAACKAQNWPYYSPWTEIVQYPHDTFCDPHLDYGGKK